MGMKGNSHLLRRPDHGYRLFSAFVLGLALVATGAAGPGAGGILSAQAATPCALLKLDEIKPVASNKDVAEGVSNGPPATRRVDVWAGVGRFTLDVTINDFSWYSPAQPDQTSSSSRRGQMGTTDAVILIEAAVFRPASPAYATAAALVKGRLLQVHLDGLFAGEKKDQVVELLKSAAARL